MCGFPGRKALAIAHPWSAAGLSTRAPIGRLRVQRPCLGCDQHDTATGEIRRPRGSDEINEIVNTRAGTVAELYLLAFVRELIRSEGTEHEAVPTVTRGEGVGVARDDAV